MRRTAYGICAVVATIEGLFAFKSNPWLQLLSMVGLFALGVAFVISVVCIKKYWSVQRSRAFLPVVACFAALVLPMAAGMFAREAYFWINIPGLEEDIRGHMENGTPLDAPWGFDGPDSVDQLTSGDTMVVYFWASGFPVKHTALMYCTSDIVPQIARERGWYHGYMLRDNWWVVDD